MRILGKKLIMFQTKYKYFNKNIKMLLLLLFILMWSLMGQQSPYGESSMSAVGFITAAVCSAEEDFYYNINGSREIIQENIAEITTKIEAKKSASSTTSATTTASENKGSSNNKARGTIYGYFNENDNNFNKLPQRVVKRKQEQTNVMYKNMIMPATPQATSSLIPAMSAGVTITTTRVPPLPLTESLVIPKGQLNKTQYSQIPNGNENKPEEEVEFNETRVHKTVQKSTSKSSNNKNIHNVSKNNIKSETTGSTLHEISSGNKIYKIDAEHMRSNIDPDEITNENSSKLTAFHSIAHAQQELILQFALKFKQIPRITYFTCRDVTKANEKSKTTYKRRHANMNMDTVEFVTRMFMSNAPSLMMKVVLMDHLVNENHGGMNNTITSRKFARSAANGTTIRNTFTNINWLEQVLRPESLRQIVVLNLACGLSSRRLLEMCYGQQQPDDKSSSTYSNASRGGITNDIDIDVIEKFLETLNININTELILAKRCTCSLVPPVICYSHTLFNMTATGALPIFTLTNSKSMDLNDKILQKIDYYLLYDVWNPGQQYGGVLNISKIGNFTRSAGLYFDKWYRTTSTIRRRLNMQLAHVRCLVVITHKNRSDTLEEYLTSHYDTHLDSMNRFNFALLTHVRELFNFSFILSKTSTWGYLKNGKFDGMIGALMRKQADIGGSPIFFRIERAKVIDYTARTWVARPCFLFRHPRGTKMDRIVFLQPFSNEIWILLLACACITVVFLWLLTTLERKFNSTNFAIDDGKVMKRITRAELQRSRQDKRKAKIKVGTIHKWFMRRCVQTRNNVKSCQRFVFFFESLLFYIGSICQQGLPFSTFFISGRCIVVTSLLFSFAIYQFYSASIVGTLLMEKPKTIRTLRDLIHSSLEIGIEDIVYNRDYFLRTKDPDAQELYAKKMTSARMSADVGFGDAGVALPTDAKKPCRDILHNHESGAQGNFNEASNWFDPDYGVAKVKRGGFAFHVDVATAYKIIADTFTEKEICDLAEIQLFPPQKMLSIVQKGSPLRKAITYGLRRVTEVGLTDYQRKVWHSPKPRCIKQVHTDDLRVDMQTFTSALWVLIFGYAAGLLILCLEIVQFKLRQQHTTLRI